MSYSNEPDPWVTRSLARLDAENPVPPWNNAKSSSEEKDMSDSEATAQARAALTAWEESQDMQAADPGSKHALEAEYAAAEAMYAALSALIAPN